MQYDDPIPENNNQDNEIDNEDDHDEPVEDSLDTNTDNVKCHDCNKEFANSRNLNKHKRKLHIV